MPPLFSQEISAFVESVDPLELLRQFDTEFDVPLIQPLATGLLRMTLATQSQLEDPALTELGLYWCEIVHADVEYRLDDGVRLINDSQPLLIQLRSRLKGVDSSKDLSPYIVGRWLDAAGKIRYRISAFSRSRINFERAEKIALDFDLWWLLPDVVSNNLRAKFQELRQGLDVNRIEFKELLLKLTADLAGAIEAAELQARSEGVDLTPSGHSRQSWQANAPDLEFVRGYSSLLHNYSIAVNEQTWIPEFERRDLSRRESNRALQISLAIGDEYRAAQAQNHLATLAEGEGDKLEAIRLYGLVASGKWQRGSLIARQRLANMNETSNEKVTALKSLLDNDLHDRSPAGNDLEVLAYTTRLFAAAARDQATSGATEAAITDDIIEAYELDAARSVRHVIAVPSYKRGYSELVRPIYSKASSRRVDITRLLGVDRKRKEALFEDALGFVEESSARELLDMISGSSLPRVDEPKAILGEAYLMSNEADLPDEDDVNLRHHEGSRNRSVLEHRRGSSRRVGEDGDNDTLKRFTDLLAERANEFESVLQVNPLEVAAHDPAIAHRLRMFAANSPGNAIVRFFPTGSGKGERMSALVVHGRQIEFVQGPWTSDVMNLVYRLPLKEAPSQDQAIEIWDLLIAEIWAILTRESLPSHLILIPVDELFSVPFHVAMPDRTSLPLGVDLPLSFSVSATAFVSRGRHMLRNTAVNDDDELVALVMRSRGVSAREIEESSWDRAYLREVEPTWSGVREIEEYGPEFFLYAGHGGFLGHRAELGPFLNLKNDIMTQFDLALRLRLPRNKLTIMAACLAGQGMASAGGEVGGFVRSLMAAGAGAIALPLWSVKDNAIVDVAGALLGASRAAVDRGGVFDIVESLRSANLGAYLMSSGAGEGQPIERVPLAVYL